jgi:SNF2 family DNA or RNA helicase
MRLVPRPYQQAMIAHALAHDRCALWASMGLGKSAATLAIIRALLLASVRRVLILAPLRVCRYVWPEELRKWDDFKDLSMALLNDKPVEAWKAPGVRACDIHVLNYEALPKFTGHEALFDYDMVVSDESTKLKSFRLRQGGRRAQILAKLSHGRVKHWINLTGTPAPNGMIDLWGQTWFLDQGARLGRTFSAFTNRWFKPHPSGFGIEILPFAADEIKEKLSDICLSIESKDHFKLPPLVTNTISAELPPAARKVYREMEKKYFAEINGKGIEAFNAATKAGKCMQIANGAIYYDNGKWEHVHDAKIEALREVIEEAAGASVMVAYQFRSDLERLRRAFPHVRVLAEESGAVADWNAGRVALLAAHPKSCGHGLNLQAGGSILVFFGLSWSLEDYQQTIERIGPTRQAQAGLDRSVFIHHIVARATLDEAVMQRLQGKADVQQALMAYMKRRTA